MATKKWWGRSVSVDLHDCEKELLQDPEKIKKFVRALCKEIKMKRHGPVRLERFGHGDLRGWSMLQFIETSSISAHFDEKNGRAFIDVFSCKKFNSKAVVKFCQKFFHAKSVTNYVEERL
ncbi:S-adenosylmethionine decarboxylase [Candidatus Woesearchaeota archaeon]|nr:S-adenosylmethionine decarboxylase [Candidatus Woesearchaeota archaeon]